MDGNGVAAVIAASVAGVVSLATLYMQFRTWKDNRDIKLRQMRMEQAGNKREGMISNLHKQVNGRLGELKIRIAKESFEMGRKFQKYYGDEPSPEMPRPKVEDLMREIEARDDTIG